MQSEIEACFHKGKRETREFIDEFEETDSGHSQVESRRYR